LKKIFESVQEKGKWRTKYNEELYKSPNIITIKDGLECKPKGAEVRGRPTLRWMRCVRGPF
jgi:hypothetical protein